jgi:hypothetical protein
MTDDMADILAFPPRQPTIQTYQQATRFFGLGLIEAGQKIHDPDVVALGNAIVNLVPGTP